MLPCLICSRALAQQPDTTLIGQIRSRALAASQEIAAARAAVAVSEMRLAAAGRITMPLVLSANVEEVPDGYRVQDAGDMSILVEKVFRAPGQGTAARALAEAELTAMRARLVATDRLVLARTELALVRAFGWAALAHRLVEQDSLLVSAEIALRTRFGVGQAGYVDVLRLRTERLRVQSALSQSLAESRAARRVLDGILSAHDTTGRRLLGHVDELIARSATRVLIASRPSPPELDSLLSDAAVIRVAQAEVRQAQAEHALLLSAQRPQLGGFVGAQRHLADNGSHVLGPVLGVSVSLPFTAATRANRTAREAARLQVVATEARLVAVRATLRADLLAARERYDAALGRLVAFDAALLQAARLEREGALAGYRAGVLTLTELLDFERGLSLAESERIQSEIAAAEALADLITTAYVTGEAPARPDAPSAAERRGF